MDSLTFRLEKVVKSKEDYEDFEGPLDLILYLLSRNRIEIKDIKLTEILDQYLEYLDKMQELDLDIASDFVAMAAHLMYLKTRMLLSADDSEVNEEMELLIRSLEERSRMIEYRKMQLGAEYLRRHADVGMKIFVKEPEKPVIDSTYPYVHSPSELTDAILQVRQRAKSKFPPPVSTFRGIIEKEPFPISVKITELVQKFIFAPVLRLKQLISGCKSRSEIIATFLAILELCRENRTSIERNGDDYEIIRVSEAESGNI
jgi:segregation and condensation protein A